MTDDQIGKYLNKEVQTFLSDVVAIVSGGELRHQLTQIDWDLSRDERKICVRSGIDDNLDKAREDYAGGWELCSLGVCDGS